VQGEKKQNTNKKSKVTFLVFFIFDGPYFTGELLSRLSRIYLYHGNIYNKHVQLTVTKTNRTRYNPFQKPYFKPKQADKGKMTEAQTRLTVSSN